MTPHVYRIFIRATPDEVWRGITDPDITSRYFHHTAFTSTVAPGAPDRDVLPDGSDAVIGDIEVAEPPSRLVVSWRILYDAVAAEEPPSRLEWLLTDVGGGTTRVDLVHGELARSPATWASVRHGWVWILDSLKSLLETGHPLAEATAGDASTATTGRVADVTPPAAESTTALWHRLQAIEANNSIWPLLESGDRGAADDEQLLRRAYAAAYHWERAEGRTPANEVRATYMIAKAHLATGDVDAARRAAERCVAECAAHGLLDFDLAYAHEVLARALHASGESERARAEWAAALTVPIADDEDRALVLADLADGLS